MDPKRVNRVEEGAAPVRELGQEAEVVAVAAVDQRGGEARGVERGSERDGERDVAPCNPAGIGS